MASPFSGTAGRNAGIWGAEAAGKFATGIQDIINEGKTGSLDALGQGRTQGLAALDAGYAAARPEYQGAIDRFNPWVDAGKGALTTYQGSLGLGGDGAIDAATGQFRASPGYQYSVDQATDGIARKASALGALGSGNTMAAISDRAQNMADQDYKNWQSQVKGVSDQGLAATGAQATIQRGLGDLGAQQGRDEAGIWGTSSANEASTLANYTGMHTQNLANLTNNVLGAGTGAMQAGQTAAQNRLNLGMQGLQLGASVLGGGMGGLGGIGTSLGQLGKSFGSFMNGGVTPGAGGLY